jgi:hypothetical protein
MNFPCAYTAATAWNRSFLHGYYLHRRRFQRRFSGAIIHAGRLTDHCRTAERLRPQFSWDNFLGCCFRSVESVFAGSHGPKGIAEWLGRREQAMREPITKRFDLLARLPARSFYTGSVFLNSSISNIWVSRISSKAQN